MIYGLIGIAGFWQQHSASLDQGGRQHHHQYRIRLLHWGDDWRWDDKERALDGPIRRRRHRTTMGTCRPCATWAQTWKN